MPRTTMPFRTVIGAVDLLRSVFLVEHGKTTMTPSQARATIEALANGIDPETGEILREESVLNSPEVIRALFVAAKALHQLAWREERKSAPLANVGAPWSECEESALLAELDGGMPVKDIAAKHGRTKGAITSRLKRLGRLQDHSETYAGAIRSYDQPRPAP